MSIKEKLCAMFLTEEANKERIQRMKDELKSFVVSYAVRHGKCADNYEYTDNYELTIDALGIADALERARNVLAHNAETDDWREWCIWCIEMIDEEVF